MRPTSSAAEKLDQVQLRRDARPVDLVHLAKQCLGDEHLEYEILRLFDTTISAYHQRVGQAGSLDDLTLALHSMRSAATGVGAWTIVDLVTAAEADMRDGRPLQPEQLADLAMAVEEVRTFIADLLSNEPN
ncbi:histidine kinase [Devosia albogilva]|uniref:Histidine kinase n=1 Tax=Devosia albogilva TaxID=429726 RepID=A0ABW5QGH1_9HYPH